MSESAVIIIPARMASSRFPNKPLAFIKGKTMIERVWRIAKMVPQANEVIIATDSDDLRDFAEKLGAQVMMTSANCLTGTDRVAEASRLLDHRHQIFFSFQGDAVLTPPWVIQDVLQAMVADSTLQMATPAIRLVDQALSEFIESKRGGSSSGTCVTFDKYGKALYFSKALIPFHREEIHPDRNIYRHIGLYAYRAATLQQLTLHAEGLFEKSEKIEALRALENGIPIQVIQVDYRGRTHGSVDRPADIAFVEGVIEREGELL
jgi:3-deoxy-manno-octulosonate cytidylyltransferase (CMP-KDO synthetase)